MERSSGAAPPRRSGAGSGGSQDGDLDGSLLGVAVERHRNSVAVVELRGELDLSTISRLEGRLLGELNANDGLVVDLTGLEFVDSSGISLLIRAHRARNGTGGMHLVVAEGSQVERVFAVAGIDRALSLFPSRREAIAALGIPPS